MTTPLTPPSEVREILKKLSPYASICYYELLNGVKLSSMNQRKQRALAGQHWQKHIDIGLAVELYKQTETLNKKGAY